MYTYKVMLKPNNKQETKIRRTLNKCIECQNIIFDYLKCFIDKKEKIPTCSDVRKWFTLQKKIKDDEIIALRKGLTNKQQVKQHLDTLFYDVSNDALKQTVKDTYNAFMRFFKGVAKFPKKKSYSDYKKSFYVDPYKIKFEEKHVILEKIASSQKKNRLCMNRIKLTEKGRIPTNVLYFNPRVVLEDNRLWISVGIEEKDSQKKKEIEERKEETIGIDVNIHSINLSNLMIYPSPANKRSYKRLEKSFKKYQRKLAKQYIKAKEENKELKQCKNRRKNQIRCSNKKRRMVHIMEDYHNKIINYLIKENPQRIHIEDLDIKGMVKNHALAKNIERSSWGKFFKKLEDKCKQYNIQLLRIDRFFPSSKRCHKCGIIKEDLTLKERIFVCPSCGNIQNRDFNAALNIRDFFKITKED